MRHRRSSLSLAIRGTLFILAIASTATSRAQLFQPLSNRHPVGDPNADSPIDSRQGPKHLTAGDLDNDGLDDIITANLDGSVSVLLGQGDGKVGEQILVPARGLLAGSSMRAVEVGDFNDDDLLDVVAADIAREGLVILLGAGNGTLTPIARIDLGPARALSAADLDNNGTLDLVVASSPIDCEKFDVCFDPLLEAPVDWCALWRWTSPSLAVLHGNGDGTFGAPVNLLEDFDGCLYDVATADLDRDGNVDVLALDYTHREILLYRNTGAGAFTPAGKLSISLAGPRAFSLAYLDERLVGGAPPENATLDIVTANRDDASLSVFLGQEGFSFSAPRTIASAGAPRGVAARDLDGDGFAELVTTYRYTDFLCIYRGLGGARYDPAPLEIPTGTSPRHVVLADFTGDGALDAAVNNRISQDVSVFTGLEGFPGFLVSKNLYPAGIHPIDIVVGDFDDNGAPDTATVSLRSHDLRVRPNLGDGTLGAETVYPLSYEPAAVVSGDVNADAHADLVVATIGSDNGSADRGTLLVLLGRGDGTFNDPAVISDGGVLYRPVSVRLGDISGDGILDIAAGGLNGDLVLYRGRGDGTFDRAVKLTHHRTGLALNLTLADFDNDGRTDIATSQAKLLLNDGEFFSGSWRGAQRNFASGVPDVDKTWFVDSADLDGDGNRDLMLALTFVRPDPIAVFFGRGDGTFHQPDIYDGPDMGVVASLAEDMDGDGILDIVIGNRCAASVIILKGLGDRKFERSETVMVYAVEGLAVADMNQDDRPDLVGAGVGLWVLLNGGDESLVEPTSGEPPGLLPEGVYINEMMAFNRRTFVTRSGATPDWLELFHHGREPRRLAGWSLRHRTRNGERKVWNFPAESVIGAGEHLVVFCGSKARGIDQGEGLICQAFGLFRGGGESIALVDADGNEADRVVFPPMPKDVSYARDADASRFLSHNPVPTLGRSNTQPNNLGPILTPDNPTVTGGSRVGVTARLFDDVGLAYASVNYRLAGERAFTETLLFDDGLHGDGLAGDALYGAMLPELPPGSNVLYYLRIVDLEGEEETAPSSGDGELLQLSIPAAEIALEISEVVADNESGLQDERGQFEDWLELENCGVTQVALDGFALTKAFFDDDAAWPFPPGVTLAPGERLVVFCDKDEEEGSLHASFRLDRDGDVVLLVRAGEPPAPVDALAFGPLADDEAFGRPSCGAEPQVLAAPTPGGPNIRSIPFRRGDVTIDGEINLTDFISFLNFLFLGGGEPSCPKAADSDDSGSLDITDSVYILNFLFLGGSAPAAPFPDCGVDPTTDALHCPVFEPCGGV